MQVQRAHIRGHAAGIRTQLRPAAHGLVQQRPPGACRRVRRVHATPDDDAATTQTVQDAGAQPAAQPAKQRRQAESTDAVASFLTRRFGIAGGLGWLAVLAVGSLGEQVKTRLEVRRRAAHHPSRQQPRRPALLAQLMGRVRPPVQLGPAPQQQPGPAHQPQAVQHCPQTRTPQPPSVPTPHPPACCRWQARRRTPVTWTSPRRWCCPAACATATCALEAGSHPPGACW